MAKPDNHFVLAHIIIRVRAPTSLSDEDADFLQKYVAKYLTSRADQLVSEIKEHFDLPADYQL